MCHDGAEDPLLPADAAAAAFLRARLAAAAVSAADTEAAVRELLPRVGQAMRSVARAAAAAAAGTTTSARTAGASGSALKVERVLGANGAERVKLSLRGARVEVHAEHYDKLRRLFALTAAAAGGTSTGTGGTPTGGTPTSTSGATNERDPQRASFESASQRASFESAAFAVLCRYTAAQGGMHRVVGFASDCSKCPST